jgi:hypothetical protein
VEEPKDEGRIFRFSTYLCRAYVASYKGLVLDKGILSFVYAENPNANNDDNTYLLYRTGQKRNVYVHDNKSVSAEPWPSLWVGRRRSSNH